MNKLKQKIKDRLGERKTAMLKKVYADERVIDWKELPDFATWPIRDDEGSRGDN